MMYIYNCQGLLSCALVQLTLHPPVLVPPFLSTGIMDLLFNLETGFDKGKKRYKFCCPGYFVIAKRFPFLVSLKCPVFLVAVLVGSKCVLGTAQMVNARRICRKETRAPAPRTVD
ncbi:uncharacterized protein BDZ83DRAFT_263510 [Colletotrichum acutatum]|uniref:Uncharacterized protein n=1 Tax=Glomerella acutata TaxID=27357 RepID=A0AAD8XHE1_GLOAC|nr:uncharacterized protein BDZ83DRAFT_263510 [Colletotrichum acutatum]KAK1726361.1 hypothetical protein BDZ83DRAFT_263510 [Colletotrichum acutatum]